MDPPHHQSLEMNRIRVAGMKIFPNIRINKVKKFRISLLVKTFVRLIFHSKILSCKLIRLKNAKIILETKTKEQDTSRQGLSIS